MKIGIQKTSLKKSIAARTKGRLTRKINRLTNPLYGKKGWGFFKDPKRSIYNKLYRKTRFSWKKFYKTMLK